MNKFIVLLLLSSLSMLTQAQEQNFIRIVGNARLEMKPEAIRLNLVLTEIERDEYQKIREKSIDEIKLELDATLKTMGYSLNDIVEIWPPKAGYGYSKKNSENYYLDAKNEEDAKRMSKLTIKGLQITKFDYVYPDVEFDDMALSKQAMSDAKRKADALAKHVGKKVGRIISIEDASNKQLRPLVSNNKSTRHYQYNLVITYELLD